MLEINFQQKNRLREEALMSGSNRH